MNGLDPSRYPSVPLGGLLQSARSGFANGEKDAKGTIQFRMNNVTKDGYIDWSDIRRIPCAKKQISEYALQDGDIVFNQTNSRDLVGKVAFFDGFDEPVLFSNHFLRARPKKEFLDGKYLAFYLHRLFRLGFFRSKCVAWVNQATFGKADFLALEIPLPPLAEQRRIAAMLDKADVIRRKHEQALALAGDFLRSTFLHMFGDPVTNPRRLPTAPIRDFGAVVTGNTPSRQVTGYYGDAIEWIKSDNINTPSHLITPAEESLSELGKSVARTAPAGSTLVTCIAGTPSCIGNAAMTDREVAFNQQINAVVPNRKTDPAFLYTQFLVAKKMVQRASTNSMKGMVSKGKFQEIRFLMPPREQQRHFGRLFGAYADQIQRIQEAGRDAAKLFASLSQRAFRGEL